MFDLGSIVLRMVSESKGIDEIEERVAEVVFALGRSRCCNSFVGRSEKEKEERPLNYS